MRQRSAAVAALALAAVFCAGCAGVPESQKSLSQRPLSERPVELVDVAFFPQRTDQCGPAALTSVLQASDVAADYPAVAQRVYLPDRGGSLQLELLAASRAYDRLPVRLAPELQAIVGQLLQGRPVLVMQNLGPRFVPRWHFAVVVGYLPATDEFVLRSGDKARHRLTRKRFLRTWARADHWAVVLFAPLEAAVGVAADAYLAEAAALEAVGRYDSALLAYRQALARWPQRSIARLGYANSLYGSGDLPAAQRAYSELLALEPENIIAANNLAHVLWELGCIDAARGLLQALPDAVKNHGLYPQLLETRRELAAVADATAPALGACDL